MPCDGPNLKDMTEFLRVIFLFALLIPACRAIREFSAYLQMLAKLDAPPRRNGVNGSGE